MTQRLYALSDAQWARIQDVLPGRPGHVGVTARDNRLFVEAVIYRYRAGIPWRNLPQCFGDSRAVRIRFARWERNGVWQRVFGRLAADGNPEWAMIESAIMRELLHSAATPKQKTTKPSATAKRPERPDSYPYACFE